MRPAAEHEQPDLTHTCSSHNVHEVSPTGSNGHHTVAGPGETFPAQSNRPSQARITQCVCLGRRGRNGHTDLTTSTRSAKLDELPRMTPAEKSVQVDGARPLLENSTACQTIDAKKPRMTGRHRDISRRAPSTGSNSNNGIDRAKLDPCQALFSR